jgi:nitrous oxidase accessory protein
MKYLIIDMLIIILLINFNGCIDISQNDSPNIIIVDIKNGYEYYKIQDAINASFENATIFVHSGIYNENIIINKNLNLIGENKTNTIIDGNGIGDVIFISESNSVNISGFTIRNSGNGSPDKDCGIDIRSKSNVINDNIILDNNNGIFQYFSNYNIISNNQIIDCSEYGVDVFSNSNYNKIYGNIFSSNNCSIRIKGSKYNEVSRNTIHSNQRGIFFCCGAN